MLMSDYSAETEPPSRDEASSAAISACCAGCVGVLESFARALRLEVVLIDAHGRARRVGDASCFATPAKINALAHRLGPTAHGQGIALAHADHDHLIDGTEVCAFPALGGLALVAMGPACARAPSLAGLRRLYGLTAAEARVARALASSDKGHSPTSIAAELGVSISTVRSHLRAIQEKCLAESQTDLVRRLLTSAAVLMSE